MRLAVSKVKFRHLWASFKMTKLKQLVKEGKFDKSWVDGLKTGLKLAKSIAKKQGYEISFPEVGI